MEKSKKKTSSIEREPRTLTFDELRFARESAQRVMKTYNLEEALKIFTEGLQPVEACVVVAVINKDYDQWNFREGLLGSTTRDVSSAPF